MTLDLSTEWAEPSLLTRVASLVDARSDIRELAGWILDPNDYRSPIDHVLVAFAPRFREPIAQFYGRRGTPLRVVLSPSELTELDLHLALTVPSACERWAAFKTPVARRG